MDKDCTKLQWKRKKLAEEAGKQLEKLRTMISTVDRLNKIEAQMSLCSKQLSALIEMSTKLKSAENEDIVKEAHEWLQQFQYDAHQVIEFAREHVQWRKEFPKESPVILPLSSQSVKSVSKCSGRRSNRPESTSSLREKIQAQKELELSLLEQEKARVEAEETERMRQREAEESERMRQREAEEAEKMRQREAKEAEKLRQREAEDRKRAIEREFESKRREIEARSKLHELDLRSSCGGSVAGKSTSDDLSAEKTKEWVENHPNGESTNGRHYSYPMTNVDLYGQAQSDQLSDRMNTMECDYFRLPNSYIYPPVDHQMELNRVESSGNWGIVRDLSQVVQNLTVSSAPDHLIAPTIPITTDSALHDAIGVNKLNVPTLSNATLDVLPMVGQPACSQNPDHLAANFPSNIPLLGQTNSMQLSKSVHRPIPTATTTASVTPFSTTTTAIPGQLPRNDYPSMYKPVPRDPTSAVYLPQFSVNIPQAQQDQNRSFPARYPDGFGSANFPVTQSAGLSNSFAPQSRQYGFRPDHFQTGANYAVNDPTIRSNYDKFLPKWKLNSFDGNPCEWPEWKGMFSSTIMRAPISDDERMTHLKTLLTGKAKIAVAAFGFDGSMFHEAWNTLEQEFGRPSAIVDSQMRKITDFPTIKMHSSSQLVEFSLAVSALVAVLRNLGFVNELSSSAYVRIAFEKLPPNLQEKWCHHIAKLDAFSVHLQEFSKWLSDESSAHKLLLEARNKTNFQANRNEKTKTSSFAANSSTRDQKKTSECPFCKESHTLWKCSGFKQKTVTERANFVRENKLCFSCLDGQHFARDCTKKLKCREKDCNRSHNTLLHGADRPMNGRAKNQDYGKEPVAHTAKESFKQLLPRGVLQVVKVTVFKESKKVETYALCDTGSTLSWISPELERQLQMVGQPTTISIQSFTGVQDIPTSLHQIGIKSKAMPDESFIDVLVKPDFHIGNDRLDITALKRECPHLEDLEDGIIDFSRIQLLLGQSSFKLIRPLEYKVADENKPWAVKLPIGWTLSGPLPRRMRVPDHLPGAMFCSETINGEDQLAQQIKHWWDIESYGSNCDVKSRSLEDKKSSEILEQTTRHNGIRYEVGMLWRDGKPNLPNNYVAAKAQFLSLEKRLEKDPALKKRYAETIAVDLQKGYIRKVGPEELEATKNCVQWYCPHHPVVNPNKPGKVRRVSNAAAKFQGMSLNDALMTGPDLLNNLVGILTRFRSFPVVLLADIEAMFHQITVSEHDQRTLRFLWREDPSSEIEVYQYLVRIFGATDSPTCANYALKRTGVDNEKEFPMAANAVQRAFYMDDLAKSVQSVRIANDLYHSIKKLTKFGGFKLTKWFSNCDEIMQQIRADGEVLMTEERSPTNLTLLGLQWNVKEDCLSVIRGTDPTISKLTQRGILSIISSVYDPLGILAPFMLKGRRLLKILWQSLGQNWDENVDSENAREFENWARALVTCTTVQLKRLLFPILPTNIELHVFADASETAMCAVLYFRGVLDDGSVELSFAIGKSRVAPIRLVTIPKLELQAAVIATRIAKQIKEEVEFNLNKVFYWTDSSTVLQWIQNSYKKQPVFVGNRVQEILENTFVNQWRYVPSAQNPADLGTRGLLPEEIKSSCWLTGPAFLKSPEKEWPTAPFNPMVGPTEKIDSMVGPPEEIVFTCAEFAESLIDWERFSNFKKLEGTIAYCTRLFSKSPTIPREKQLSANERRIAQFKLWKIVQSESFDNDVRALTKVDDLPLKSSIRHLMPFIDDDGIVRAAKRLRKCSGLPESAKFLIILSAKHPAVELFLHHLHELHHHQGVEYLRSVVQQSFWILKLRSALRYIKKRCLFCKRRRADHLQPKMADLPTERINPSL